MKVFFKPQGAISLTADCIMIPMMYLLQGQLLDVPQRTHFWNNKKFLPKELKWLHPDFMVMISGDADAKPRQFLPFFHMPLFGGWKKFAVISPVEKVEPWFIGWKTDHACGLSLVKIHGSVRVLRGPSGTIFFGVNINGLQIPLQCEASGTLGENNQFNRILLL